MIKDLLAFIKCIAKDLKCPNDLKWLRFHSALFKSTHANSRKLNNEVLQGKEEHFRLP